MFAANVRPENKIKQKHKFKRMVIKLIFFSKQNNNNQTKIYIQLSAIRRTLFCGCCVKKNVFSATT